MKAVILAGGEGSRLGMLTAKRAKPAVPFAGKYRITPILKQEPQHQHERSSHRGKQIGNCRRLTLDAAKCGRKARPASALPLQGIERLGDGGNSEAVSQKVTGHDHKIWLKCLETAYPCDFAGLGGCDVQIR